MHYVWPLALAILALAAAGMLAAEGYRRAGAGLALAAGAMAVAAQAGKLDGWAEDLAKGGAS